MSEHRDLLCDTAAALFAAQAGEAELREAGFDTLLSAGGDWGDAFAILRLAGMHHPVSAVPAVVLDDRFEAQAFARVALAAGALDRILEMSIEHASTRVQFGKPLSKLQAVQQSLAMLAVEAAAVNSAGMAAAAALDAGDAVFEIAAAKLRANRAMGIGAAIAHQAHGAIGFTREHDLHRYTSALARWRSEYGNDRHWAERLGALALRAGDGLWAEMTSRSDRTLAR